MDRRTFLAVTGTALPTLAGCVGTRSPGSEDEDENEDTPPTESSTHLEEADANESEGESADDEPDDDDEPETDERAAVGELIEGEDLHVVVLDQRREAAYDGLVKTDDESIGISRNDEREAQDGHEFLVLEVAVKNVSDEAFVSVGEQLTPSVRDVDDRSHARLESEIPGVLSVGTLAPGEVERAEIAYELPEGASEITLDLVDDGETTFDRSTVDLEERADSTADLEQDFRIPLQEFGSSVESDGVTVTVDGLELGNDVRPFAQPAEGQEYVIVGFSVENDSGGDLELSRLEDVHLKDETGWNYPDDPDVVSAIDRFDDECLEDGEATSGELAYEVERGRDRLYWIADLSRWGVGERTIWQLR
ncbi:DUF4352 domain-containing protein [Natrialbaceae archaeon A-gly3]